jgi:hypothetical protein
MENEDYDNIAIFIASLYTNFKSIFTEKINKRRLKQCHETQREIKTLEDVYFDTKCVVDDTKCVVVDTKCVVVDTKCVDTKCVDTKCVVDDTKCVDTKCLDIIHDIELYDMKDSWSLNYGIESVKIYHGHVCLHHSSNDTSEDDF